MNTILEIKRAEQLAIIESHRTNHFGHIIGTVFIPFWVIFYIYKTMSNKTVRRDAQAVINQIDISGAGTQSNKLSNLGATPASTTMLPAPVERNGFPIGKVIGLGIVGFFIYSVATTQPNDIASINKRAEARRTQVAELATKLTSTPAKQSELYKMFNK